MMSRDQIIGSLVSGLVECGFKGRGRSFHLSSKDVAWLVQLELVPRSLRVGLSVGICPAALAAGGWPKRANDCPIILDPSSGGSALFGDDGARAWDALDAGSALVDGDRIEGLLRLCAAIGSAAKGVDTLERLKEAFAEGKLNEFLRKDARTLLEPG